jgi:hypothetical protein
VISLLYCILPLVVVVVVAMGNEVKSVVISIGSREDSIPRLLIVKLAWTSWSTPVVFLSSR